MSAAGRSYRPIRPVLEAWLTPDRDSARDRALTRTAATATGVAAWTRQLLAAGKGS